MKTALEKLYGPRLKQVLLYGSRARGDHQPDSDYDVLVVLDPPLDYWPEQKRLSLLSSELTFETARSEHPIVASFRPATPEELEARTGFMHNVRSEAIAL